MRTALFSLLFIPFLLQAQFSGPNAIAYNASKDLYFISNYSGKNVVSMNRAGQKAVFISGLSAPNNIFYGTLPLGEGYLVLDSNEVALYDSAGAYFVTQSISGARKLQDIAVDEDSAVVYISDVDRGVIYKITFSPAPFYFPITEVFVKNLRRPSALIFQKKQRRVLFALDTAGTDLFAFDVKTAAVSTVKTLGMNRIIGLGEDAQGNLYISSPGEKYIYQLNKYLAGTPKKLFGEPKPGDLYINPARNEWVFTCVQCNSVNKAPIHDFGPMADMAGCRGDSVSSYRSTLQKNYGSFEPGNEFIVEMSDSFGKFTVPIIIGRVKDTILPDEIRCKLPLNKKGSDKYLQRWRSTKPAITGTFADMEVYKDPLAYLYGTASVDACIGTAIQLGKFNKISPDLAYSWYPPGEVDSPTNARVQHIIADTLRIYLQVRDNISGCVSKDSVRILPVTKPDLGTWLDTLNVCSASSIFIGKTAKGGLTYAWSPSVGLSDSSLARPLFNYGSDVAYTLKVSGAGGCFSMYKQFVDVHQTPIFNLQKASDSACFGDSAENTILGNWGADFDLRWNWGPNILSYNASQKFPYPFSPQLYNARVTDKRSGCFSTKTFLLYGNPLSKPSISKQDDTTLRSNVTGYHSFNWYRNDSILPGSGDQIIAKQSGIYKVCALNATDCEGCSDTIRFVYTAPVNSVRTLFNNCHVFPNPASGVVYLDCALPGSVWTLRDMSGRQLRTGRGAEVDMSGLAPGNYSLLCMGYAVRVMLH